MHMAAWGSMPPIAPTVIAVLNLEARVDHIWPCLDIRDATRSSQVCIRWPNLTDPRIWPFQYAFRTDNDLFPRSLRGSE